jgi:ribonuclease HI
MSDKVVIYTDGACSGNPGVGGWGAVLIYKNNGKEIFGGNANTTNNKMELTAVIEALSLLKRKCGVNVYTDSQYVKKGITEWIGGWEKNNWKTSKKQDVLNRELWQELNRLVKQYNIEWFWVKGHNNNKLNERADELAREGIKKQNMS